MNTDICTHTYTHIHKLCTHTFTKIHLHIHVRVRGWVAGGVVWCGVVWCGVVRGVVVEVSLSLVFSTLKLVRPKGFFRWTSEARSNPMWTIFWLAELSIRDEPNVRLRCSWNFQKNTGFTDEKNTRLTTTPYPLPFHLHLVYIQKSPCMPAPRAHVQNTCARGAGMHGVFNVSHTTHIPHTTPQPTTTTRPPHHTETDRERQRERRRRKRRKQENRREKREVRRFFFSVVVHGRFLLV